VTTLASTLPAGRRVVAESHFARVVATARCSFSHHGQHPLSVREVPRLDRDDRAGALSFEPFANAVRAALICCLSCVHCPSLALSRGAEGDQLGSPPNGGGGCLPLRVPTDTATDHAEYDDGADSARVPGRASAFEGIGGLEHDSSDRVQGGRGLLAARAWHPVCFAETRVGVA
jgi:hypothetical protein